MSDMTPVPPSIEGQILTYQQDEQAQTLMIGTPAWYSWLQTATTFTFTNDKGTFTARREQAGNKRGGWYWRAYHKHAGKRRRVYLGRSQEVTRVGHGISLLASRPCARPSPGATICSLTRSSASFACFPSSSTGVR